jgi:hypothetical protein
MPHNLETKKGDTWAGFTATVTINGSPLDFTGATFLMQARRSATAPDVAFEFEPISPDPSAGIITVPSRIVSAPSGQYCYDLEATLSSGRVITLLEGEFVVNPDISR